MKLLVITSIITISALIIIMIGLLIWAMLINRRKDQISNFKFGDKIGKNKYFITSKFQGAEDGQYSYYDSDKNSVEYGCKNDL